MQRIEAELVVPGHAEPWRNGVVVMDGGSITYVGTAADAPDTPDATVARASTVMPGLWDCHAHFMGATTLDLASLAVTPLAVRAARCVPDLRAALDAGFTSVREVGGLGTYLARTIDEGTVVGPHIYAAGAILSTTGGHGDLHSVPLPWMADLCDVGAELRLADGPAECARAAREQLRKGARLIKICASGGVFSELDHPIHQQFTLQEMRAIVEVATMAERVVAAHCHGKRAMIAALEAGVSTIEHGTYLDDEVCTAMKETGAILVPTRAIVEEILASDTAPDYVMEKGRAVSAAHAEAIVRAHEAGVVLASGSDFFSSGRRLPAAWGDNGRELPLLVAAGLSPLEAIEAATATGPRTLGPQAPRSGLLAVGYDADVITLDDDPLADIRVLADSDRIVGVWKSGVRVKE
jgi:imidazolonepropionase-like amidohydrolase